MTGDERESLVIALLPVVRLLARRVARLCRLRDEDDLIGDGALGLIRAIDRYDPARGVSLDKYARHLIVGAMLNGLRRRDPVSERARRRIRDGERVRRELETNGRRLENREIEALVPGFTQALASVHTGIPLSLDAPLPLGARMRVDWNADPARAYEIASRRSFVRGAIDRLPPRQREIVVQHYFGEETLRTISERMAVSPQRASQIHLAALQRLRSAVRPEIA